MPRNETAPVFTLQPFAAPRPTWWQAHRHQVLSTAALVGGFVLGSHSTSTPAADAPPAHIAPAHPSSQPTPSR